MKQKMPVIVRVLFGLLFFIFGVIGLFNLIPPPAEMPEKLKVFNAGMEASGYMMKLVKGCETICGLLIMAGFFVPLCLVILAPIMVNIVFVHAFMAPEGLPIPIVLGIMMVYLSFFAKPYSDKIKALFVAK